MDSDEVRGILSRSRIGIWAMIDAAIRVASSDHAEEFRRRRDSIVESLYAPAAQACPNCSGGAAQDHRIYQDNNNTNSCDVDVDDDDNKTDRNLDKDRSKSPLTPESNHRDFSGGENEGGEDPFAEIFDDEQDTIFGIKDQLDDPDQSDDNVIRLLQELADMDITFQALKQTDIGRYVNRLRKHPSNEARRLVKQLVRKWKETVDEWVKVNQPQAASNLLADVDSPQQNIPKHQQNGHQQVPDFGYSPNPKVGSSSAEINYFEHEPKPKPAQSVPRMKTLSRPPQSAPKPAATLPPSRLPQKEPAMDDARLNLARRRLQENYQEAQNAKKQRTIQVMDIHDLPKPKNTFFAKNKGGGGGHGRNHR